MSGTGAQFASWFNLAALANVSAKSGEILVVNVTDVIDAECTDLASRRETPPTGTTASRSTWSRTTVSAFARCLWAAEASATTAEGRTIATAAVRWALAAAIVSIELRAVATTLSFFTHCADTFSVERAWSAVKC